MILGVHHSCVIVSDMDRSLAFYRDILGLKILNVGESGGEETSQGVGVKSAKLKAAMLKAGDDIVELIQYVNPKGKPYDRLPCDIGNMHIAFRVSDINKMYGELIKKGVKFNALPLEFKTVHTKSLWVYFKDPDGAQLELVEKR